MSCDRDTVRVDYSPGKDATMMRLLRGKSMRLCYRSHVSYVELSGITGWLV